VRDLRRALYGTASALGDLVALGRGPVAFILRLGRKAIWRTATRFLP
jgi:hypothetical protein